MDRERESQRLMRAAREKGGLFTVEGEVWAVLV